MESEHTNSHRKKHVCPCCGARIPYHKFPLFRKDFVVTCSHCDVELVPEKSGKNYFIVYILFSIVWWVGPQIIYNSMQGTILQGFLIYLTFILMGHGIFILFLANTVNFIECKE